MFFKGAISIIKCKEQLNLNLGRLRLEKDYQCYTKACLLLDVLPEEKVISICNKSL